MSACNLIVHPDAAYLLTDTACFLADGTISGFACKVFTVPSLSVAITLNGYADAQLWTRFQELNACRDQQELMFKLWMIIADKDNGAYGNYLVAAYSPVLQQPVGLSLWTDRPPEGKQPMQFYAMGAVVSPEVETGDWQMGAPSTFRPERDALPLIEAQRQVTDGWEPLSPGCHVGGDIQLTAVTAGGIEMVTFHGYPDEIGHRAGEGAEVYAAYIAEGRQ